MKRALLTVAGAVLLLLVLAFAFRVPLTLQIMERRVAANMATDSLADLPDGLHVVLCGAGSPLPDPQRSGPCVAVIAGQQIVVVDAGSGGSRNLSFMRLPQGRIEAIFLTHFHSDHIDGLGELLLQRWVGGARTSPTPLYGPPGVEDVAAGFNLAYRQDHEYRVAHHGEKTVPSKGAGAEARPFVLPTGGIGSVVYDEGGLEVTAFEVDHAPVSPAVGYRFDYKGRSVVISGDTVESENLERQAKGVDLLVHEALSPELVGVLTEGARSAGRENLVKITSDILDYHASPVAAAEIARDASVDHLLYYHIVPPLLLPPMEEIFLEGVTEVYEGPVTVGKDGTAILLPAGGDEIEVRQLL